MTQHKINEAKQEVSLHNLRQRINFNRQKIKMEE